jgi:hypothetical protein
MTTLAEFNTMVDRVLQDDDGKLTSDEIDGFIQTEATQLYSRHRPYSRITDMSASGVYSYEINTTTFPGWTVGFSAIKKVRYPADQYQNPKEEEVPFEEWAIYENTTKTYLRFLYVTPTAGYTIRAFYITPHSVPDAGTATIYSTDEGAFVNLAASFCAHAIAKYYGQTSDSTIGADAVAYRDKSDIWASRAKDLYKLYIDYMFPNHVEASMAMREFDTIYGELGLSRLTHKEWAR